MSNTDPNVVQETAEEIDALVPEGAVVVVEEQVDIAAPSASFLEESDDSDSDPNIAHKRRLRKVKTIEKHLSAQEGLKWHERMALGLLEVCLLTLTIYTVIIVDSEIFYCLRDRSGLLSEHPALAGLGIYTSRVRKT